MSKFNYVVRVLCVGLSISAIRFGIGKVLHPKPAPTPDMKHSIYEKLRQLNYGTRFRADSDLQSARNFSLTHSTPLTEMLRKNPGELKQIPAVNYQRLAELSNVNPKAN